MSFLHSACAIVLLICTLVQVHSQDLVCKQCDKSRKGSCIKDQECSKFQSRCLVIHWGANHIKPNTYTMRCATEDECTDTGRKALCQADVSNCDAKCCEYSRCDPNYMPKFIQTAERDYRCHHCNSESIDSCKKTEAKCDDDQDACISFLMEGGNMGKVYTKRCARKNECGESVRDRLCMEEMEESQRKSCRSSCCFEQLCNTAGMRSISGYLFTAFVVISFVVILN